MNIDGVNTLACTLACSDLRSKDVRIYPLPHMPVVKDLIPDLTQFYEQYAAVKPWLTTRSPAPANGERLQSKEQQEKVDRPSACILCACCSTSCPSYWWNSDRYLGPAALLAAYRWIIDSRDEATGERLDELDDAFKLYRCHTHHELHRSLSQGPQSGARHRPHQGDDCRAQGMSAQLPGRGQLAWHCRRGMKELDLLLLDYLDGRWTEAAADERTVFEAFLELPDPVIAGYLLGDDQPPDAGTRSLVESLRAAGRPASPAPPGST